MAAYFDYSKTYYKAVKPNGGQYGLRYKLGLNIDPMPFSEDPYPSGMLSGIHFSEKRFIGDSYEDGTLVAEIRVPSDARVAKIREGKWRADKVEILRFIDKFDFLHEIGDQDGDLRLGDLKVLKNIKLPNVNGCVFLQNAKKIKNVEFGDIGMDLNLANAIKMQNVKFGKYIKWDLLLKNIKKLKNIAFPDIGFDLYLDNLKSMKNVKFGRIGHSLHLNSLRRFKNVEFGDVEYKLYIYDASILPGDFIRIKVKGHVCQEKRVADRI